MTEICGVYLAFSSLSLDDGSVSITSWPNVKIEIEMTVERQTQTLMNRTWEQTQLQLNSFCCKNNSFIHLPRQFSRDTRLSNKVIHETIDDGVSSWMKMSQEKMKMPKKMMMRMKITYLFFAHRFPFSSKLYILFVPRFLTHPCICLIVIWKQSTINEVRKREYVESQELHIQRWSNAHKKCERKTKIGTKRIKSGGVDKKSWEMSLRWLLNQRKWIWIQSNHYVNE